MSRETRLQDILTFLRRYQPHGLRLAPETQGKLRSILTDYRSKIGKREVEKDQRPDPAEALPELFPASYRDVPRFLWETYRKSRLLADTFALVIYGPLYRLLRARIPLEARQRLAPLKTLVLLPLWGLFLLSPLLVLLLGRSWRVRGLATGYWDNLFPVWLLVVALVALHRGLLMVLVLWREHNMRTFLRAWVTPSPGTPDSNREDVCVTLVHVPQDDRNQWRKTYTVFFSNVHPATVQRPDRDVLLGRAPFISFGIHKFNTTQTAAKAHLPPGTMDVAAPYRLIPPILSHLGSLHPDLHVEHHDIQNPDPLMKIPGAHREGKPVAALWLEAAPVGGNLTSLTTPESPVDPLRTLASTMSSLPPHVLAAGAQVFLTDAVNRHEELAEELQRRSMARAPKDALSKDAQREIERKARASHADLCYNVVYRLYVLYVQSPEGQQEAQALLSQMKEWLSALQGQNRIVPLRQGGDVATVIYRVPPILHHIHTLAGPEEVAPAWHIPDATEPIAFIPRRSFRRLVPSSEVIAPPGEWKPVGRRLGVFHGIGESGDFRTVVVQYTQGKNPPAAMNTHVLGPPGVGKSTLLSNMIADDMDTPVRRVDGRVRYMSVVCIEPHRDLTNDVMRNVPPHRMEDIFLLDPTDPMPPALNFLHTQGDPEEMDREVGMAYGVLARGIPDWASLTRAGVHTRHAIHLLMALGHEVLGRPATLVDLYAFLSSHAYRERFFAYLQQHKQEWGELWSNWAGFLELSPAEQQKRLDAAATRIDQYLLSNPYLRRMVASPHTSIDVGRIMDTGRILLAVLTQEIGAVPQRLLGGLLLSMVIRAALARARLGHHQRWPTGLYIDEAHVILTGNPEDIIWALSQTRKYNLQITLANQNLAQFEDPRLREAVLSNVGSFIWFRLVADDAQVAATKIFAQALRPEDFTNLPAFHAHCVLKTPTNNTTLATIKTFPPREKYAYDLPGFSGRWLNQDTARALGLPFPVQHLPTDRDPNLLVAYLFSHMPDMQLYALLRGWALDRGYILPWPHYQKEPWYRELRRELIALDNTEWTRFWDALQRWMRTQRELLEENPGYIPHPGERAAHLSRLQVGIPALVSDAIVGRVYDSVVADTEKDIEWNDDLDISLDDIDLPEL